MSQTILFIGCGSDSHGFSSNCIDQWEEKEGEEAFCPDCREGIYADVSTYCRPLQSIIMGLKVRCPAEDVTVIEENEGTKSRPKKRNKARPTQCQWEGTLASFLDMHKTCECDYTKVKCPMCNSEIVASKITTHKKEECERRLVPCQKCKQEVVSCQLKEHQDTVCPEQVVKCSSCGAKTCKFGQD